MKKLILIGGQPGSGKTSLGDGLFKKLNNSAFIESDSLIRINPFAINEESESLLLKNALSVIKNYFDDGFEYVIVCGLVKNQNSLNGILEKICSNIDFLFVWLRASREIRGKRKENRNRDEADKSKWLDFVDNLIPDVDSFDMPRGKYIKINTDDLSISEAIKEVKSNL